MGPLCAQKLFRSPAHKRHMGKLEKNARYFDKECCIYMPPLSEFYWTFQQLIRVTVVAVQSASQIRLFATHGLQHARLPCPSLSPRVSSNSCPLSRWCHPTVSSSVIPSSSRLQSFPASGSFLTSQLFASGGQSIRPSASVLLMNIQDWFPLGLTGLILQLKGPSRIFSNESALRIRWPKYWSFSNISPSNEHPRLISFRMDWLDLLAVQGTVKSLLQLTVQKHQFFGVQLSSQSNSHIHTWPLEKPYPWLDGPLLAK